ncbi:hypothetical protein L1987_23833 [Smallanthus sonchifolius]|uniref:Uncharacterized protein n=1 Tax=Smallanthus sonchifolius TaxID=185202 RepID=A0ACB9ILD9_9ASTR|nr:hypothetical protein L1987_23833 [Smallanthus sonchifolius]
MNLRVNFGFAILFLFAFFAASSVYAQDVAGDNDREDSTGSVIDLGRRSKSFNLTFLAKWGDRSQIATIVLATHKNALGAAVGAIAGHTICTSVAVIGGSILASKISQGIVATVGGLLFLGFSLSSYFYPPLQ